MAGNIWDDVGGDRVEWPGAAASRGGLASENTCAGKRPERKVACCGGHVTGPGGKVAGGGLIV